MVLMTKTYLGPVLRIYHKNIPQIGSTKDHNCSKLFFQEKHFLGAFNKRA